MSDSSLVVPNPVTFEQAIAITQSLLAAMESGISAAQIQSTIADLVHSENGARGFFVTYLTDERLLADEPSTAVVQALQSAPETVAELLVKNLAMSTAMAIAHRRNHNEEMAQGSDRVQRRTTQLIHQVKLSEVSLKAQKLLHSVVTGAGEYQTFLDRWGYDDEQRQRIGEALQPLV
ncbi:MAG: hypothetical protein KME15_23155 [Drouetiella hepatica Uher 2000/2452]|jgi:hypothetical protein|uniref:Uncharacterized protein n=1 Tax=Drouetiella hepatica Uher 2000/2452 TaxID=904376 RepID=A0A951QI05_9CYAN|nr:hypothetical protein [Drouetiella hepatica Uher 2000/2452]